MEQALSRSESRGQGHGEPARRGCINGRRECIFGRRGRPRSWPRWLRLGEARSQASTRSAEQRTSAAGCVGLLGSCISAPSDHDECGRLHLSATRREGFDRGAHESGAGRESAPRCRAWATESRSAGRALVGGRPRCSGWSDTSALERPCRSWRTGRGGPPTSRNRALLRSRDSQDAHWSRCTSRSRPRFASGAGTRPCSLSLSRG